MGNTLCYGTSQFYYIIDIVTFNTNYYVDAYSD